MKLKIGTEAITIVLIVFLLSQHKSVCSGYQFSEKANRKYTMSQRPKLKHTVGSLWQGVQIILSKLHLITSVLYCFFVD